MYLSIFYLFIDLFLIYFSFTYIHPFCLFIHLFICFNYLIISYLSIYFIYKFGLALVAQLVECPIRGTRGQSFDPELHLTNIVKMVLATLRLVLRLIG